MPVEELEEKLLLCEHEMQQWLSLRVDREFVMQNGEDEGDLITVRPVEVFLSCIIDGDTLASVESPG